MKFQRNHLVIVALSAFFVACSDGGDGPTDIATGDAVVDTGEAGDVPSDAFGEDISDAVVDVLIPDVGQDLNLDTGSDAGNDVQPMVECGRIRGTMPFGVRMWAKPKFIEETEDGPGGSLGWHDIFFDLYFPQGRSAGARVVAVAEGYCPVGACAVEATLDEGSDADFSLDGYYQSKHLAFNGRLGADVVQSSKVTYNLAQANEPLIGKASANFCNMGTLTDPALDLQTYRTHRGGTVWFSATTPIDLDDVVVKVSVGGTENENVNVIEDNGRIGIVPKSLYTGTGELKVDFTGTTDVIGRDVPYSLELDESITAVIGATTSIVDRTFAESPPTGAVAGYGWSVEDGVFGADMNLRDPNVIVLGLGALTPSIITVSGYVKCKEGAATTRFDLVSNAGVVDSFTPSCALNNSDIVLHANVAGEFSLVLTHVPLQICPQEDPPSNDSNEVFIDQITIVNN